MSKLSPEDYLSVSARSTKTYVLALSLVGTLSILAYFMMHEVIQSHHHRAAVINVSGRQRMLSQRIALYSEYWVDAQPQERKAIETELVKATELFEKSHRDLSLGSEELGEPFPQVQKIYFAEPYFLDAEVKTFLAKVRSLPARLAQPGSESIHTLDDLRELEAKILPHLDQVVSLNQAESENQVVILQDIEAVILLCTLLLLMIEAFFIFRPMVKSISKLLVEAMEAREIAVKATDAKSAFLATITHEIRSPMTGVLGITEALLETDLPEQQRDQVHTLNRLSLALISLVNDILDYSKIEAGQLTLENLDFGLSALANDTKVLFHPAADRKGIDFQVEVDPKLPLRAVGDPSRLRQVVTNFVGNALKFTPAGGTLRLRLKQVENHEADIRLRIEVQDTGTGIPLAAQAKLFTRYTQVDQTIARSHGGTGLGLAICKQIAELMGGQIGLVSEEGVGSTFWFEVSLARSTQLQSKVFLANATLPPILLVEDNEINRSVMRAQLVKMGFTVEVAQNGVEAFQAASQTQFSVILMDCEMPVMDGFEATTRIREQEQKSHSPRTLIIALTGHSGQEVLQKCQQAGMDELITKPIPQKLLAATLQKCLGKTSLLKEDGSHTHAS